MIIIQNRGQILDQLVMYCLKCFISWYYITHKTIAYISEKAAAAKTDPLHARDLPFKFQICIDTVVHILK